MTAVLKEMTWPDIEAVVAIENELFAADPWTAELFWAELAEVGNSRSVMCAWDEDKIIGYASFRYVGKDGDVNTIAVKADQQGQGTGRQLMQWMYAEAALHGVDTIFLEVRSDNNIALCMYEKDGFERIDVRKNYYGTDIDAIVMRKRLGK
jgi:ribosomal-protein-alanine N-acetyltransferase